MTNVHEEINYSVYVKTSYLGDTSAFGSSYNEEERPSNRLFSGDMKRYHTMISVK